MSFSTHVLDATSGSPAVGMTFTLSQGEKAIATAMTDDDGRWRFDEELSRGTYRVVFNTGSYFEKSGTPNFYPEVAISFTVADPSSHYHVPLLLSPFAYSTYRGS